MTKRSKHNKQTPNFVIFLVEGESDIITLEMALSELIYCKYPNFEVRFLLQEILVNKKGDELNEPENELEEPDDSVDYIEDEEFQSGGDITSSYYVNPDNIERKITQRFIKPATKAEGLYPKRIAKIIQIVDLDGTFIPEERIIPLTSMHKDHKGYYYDGENGTIESSDIEAVINRNRRKAKNINYLSSLTELKVDNKSIPYEIYFFSSNLDHFIHNNANIEGGKKKLAGTFMRIYGLDKNAFCNFFINDPHSIGHLGYKESWKEIKNGINSVQRHTNIDCLIRSLMVEKND